MGFIIKDVDRYIEWLWLSNILEYVLNYLPVYIFQRIHPKHGLRHRDITGLLDCFNINSVIYMKKDGTYRIRKSVDTLVFYCLFCLLFIVVLVLQECQRLDTIIAFGLLLSSKEDNSNPYFAVITIQRVIHLSNGCTSTNWRFQNVKLKISPLSWKSTLSIMAKTRPFDVLQIISPNVFS